MKTCVCSSRQNYVRVNGDEWSTLFDYLSKNGYKNPHGLTKDVLPPYRVVCIDQDQSWFCSVNVTVMACAISSGKKVVSVSEVLG